MADGHSIKPVRNVEHVSGNWATHIFIPSKRVTWKVCLMVIRLVQVPEPLEIPSKFHRTEPLASPDYPYHISLSRTVYVKGHQKELFLRKVQTNIRKVLRNQSLPEFLDCSSLAIYSNDEKSRTFLAVDVDCDESLLTLVKAVDEVLKDFALPTYYSPPKFHFSLAWSLEQHDAKLIDLNSCMKCPPQVKLSSNVTIKCGNVLIQIKS